MSAPATPDPIAARAFLVGCPRSGTTLLQSLLAAHPRVHSFPESHFFDRILRLPAPRRDEALHQFLRNAGIAELGNLWPPNKGTDSALRALWDHVGEWVWPWRRDAALVPAFVRILDQATLAQGKDCWLEKTPPHLHAIGRIRKYVPSARFLHIIRTGVDTVTSLYRVVNANAQRWGGRMSIYQCMGFWKREVRVSLRYLGAPDHHLVRYENLVADPEGVVAGACSFLGLPFVPAVIDAHAAVARRLVLPHEVWKQKVFEGIRRSDGATEAPAVEGVDRRWVERRLRSFQARLDEKLPVPSRS
jgi:hypothetical protein